MSATDIDQSIAGLESHFVAPGTSTSLCGTPTTGGWRHASDPDQPMSCEQCRVQKHWLPALGDVDRDTELQVMIEPWPAGQRKHVTGDDDPERGRRHRPSSLQLCVACVHLRGPYDRFDNLCRCDRDVWDRQPTPRCGDLSSNVQLCMSCLSNLVAGSSRWSLYHCRQCLPRVAQLGRLAGRCVVPIGRHSLMNGTFWRNDGGEVTDDRALAFCDQLSAMFRDQADLYELAERRTRVRVAEFEMTDHAVGVDDYLARCVARKWNARRGFIDFVQSIGQGIDTSTARQLWKLRPPTS